ncbi:Superinfection immunity protein [Rhodospirillales bacterium URHD0017]|nr:Superinfection immunity protein [Rhodospirillales bacterium URHD0017]
MASVIVHAVYVTAFVALYFIPSIIAFYRAKPSRFRIAFLNLLTGWTTIGWLAAFVWACV